MDNNVRQYPIFKWISDNIGSDVDIGPTISDNIRSDFWNSKLISDNIGKEKPKQSDIIIVFGILYSQCLGPSHRIVEFPIVNSSQSMKQIRKIPTS